MQILFNVLMGFRRQEINGLKYSDVDYINRTISVERQLGKELNREPYAPNDGATKKEASTNAGNKEIEYRKCFGYGC